MDSRVFDVLKWIAIIVLPALSTFIATVFPIWGIAYGPEIAQTITALHTFLGAVLVVDTVNYINKKKKDGIM